VKLDNATSDHLLGAFAAINLSATRNQITPQVIIFDLE
jgi:hypothetical protein